MSDQSSIMETCVKIKIGTIKSEQTPVKTGLKQEDLLSFILFNIVLGKGTRKMNIGQHEGVNLQSHYRTTSLRR